MRVFFVVVVLDGFVGAVGNHICGWIDGLGEKCEEQRQVSDCC